MSAFEMLRKLADGTRLRLTANGEQDCEGRICREKPDNPGRVIVFVGKFQWFEFTEQSDIEMREVVCGRHWLHVN